MQLMPATAKKIARKTKTPYSRRRLFTDPQYNLKLGQAYVAHLFDFFSGSYVLSLAAYNAGPGRVRKWIRANGDPRDDNVDPIDWVELIPFNETRDYVQRVLENLQLYRLRLSRNKVVMNLEGDLRR